MRIHGRACGVGSTSTAPGSCHVLTEFCQVVRHLVVFLPEMQERRRFEFVSALIFHQIPVIVSTCTAARRADHLCLAQCHCQPASRLLTGINGELLAAV